MSSDYVLDTVTFVGACLILSAWISQIWDFLKERTVNPFDEVADQSKTRLNIVDEEVDS
jgi:hypothetical protein